MIPEPTLLSLYAAYPRKTGRKQTLPKLAEALERISQGEIDGAPRTEAEAVTWLRERIDTFRLEVAGREERFIPHMTTWLNRRRYLRTEKTEEMPKRLEVCVAVLAMYPKMPTQEHIAQNVASFLPGLNAIDRCIAGQPASFVEYLGERVATYAFHVSRWPQAELQYVPSPQRWFSERRFEQHEQLWIRSVPAGYEQERAQVKRLLGS